MKKILLLIVVTVLFSACNAILKPQVNSAVIDYKILSNHNIFASEANSVYFEYTPIGSFSFYAVGGYDETNIYKELNPCIYDVYAEIIKKAKDCNANGIINFKISTQYKYYNSTRYHTVLEASGMLINIPGKPETFYEFQETANDKIILLKQDENNLIAVSKNKLKKSDVEEIIKNRKGNIQFWWYDNNYANFTNEELIYDNKKDLNENKGNDGINYPFE